MLTLVSDWIKIFRNFSSASTKICQNRHWIGADGAWSERKILAVVQRWPSVEARLKITKYKTGPLYVHIAHLSQFRRTRKTWDRLVYQSLTVALVHTNF